MVHGVDHRQLKILVVNDSNVRLHGFIQLFLLGRVRVVSWLPANYNYNKVNLESLSSLVLCFLLIDL